MEKVAYNSPELLKLTTKVKFLINGFECTALMNTSIENSIINVKEMLKLPSGLVMMSMFGYEHLPMGIMNAREEYGEDGPFYSTRLEIEMDHEKEVHLFEFRRHPNPEYVVELGLNALRGRMIDTR